MVYEVKRDKEEEAIEWLDVTIEGLSLSDPTRDMLINLREFFTRDFSIKTFGGGLTSASAEAIAEKLNKKNVMEGFKLLIDTMENFKQYKENIDVNVIEPDTVSILTTRSSIDVRGVTKSADTSIRVVCGSECLIPIYYTIGTRVRPVEVLSGGMDNKVTITHKYTYKLVGDTISSKVRNFKNYIQTSSGEEVEVDTNAIKTSTKYLEVTEVSYVDIDTIKDAITVLDVNTSVVLSTNKTIIKSKGINSVKDSIAILTNDILLEDKDFYRVVANDTVVSTKYTYSPENPEFCLVHTIGDETVEEYDKDNARRNYNVYTNKVDADNASREYNNAIKSIEESRLRLDKFKEELEKEKEALINKAKVLDARSIKIDKKATLMENKNTEGEAKAKKLEAESEVLAHKAVQEEYNSNNLERKRLDEIEKRMEERRIARAEYLGIDVKTLSVGVGAAVVAYGAYYKYGDSSDFKRFAKGGFSLLRHFI